MKNVFHGAWLGIAAFVGAACSPTGREPMLPVATPAVLPAVATMPYGTARQLTTENLPGDSLLWTSSDSTLARVDQTGFVRAVRVGTVTISAATRGLPSRSARSVITITTAGAGGLLGPPTSLTLSYFVDARTGLSVFATEVRDSIGVVGLLHEWRIGSTLELVVSGVRDTVLTRPVPPDFFSGPLAVGWNTDARSFGGARAFPDGEYTVSLRLRNSGIVTPAPNAVKLTVLNR